MWYNKIKYQHEKKQEKIECLDETLHRTHAKPHFKTAAKFLQDSLLGLCCFTHHPLGRSVLNLDLAKKFKRSGNLTFWGFNLSDPDYKLLYSEPLVLLLAAEIDLAVKFMQMMILKGKFPL